jgi:hypothetical protein
VILPESQSQGIGVEIERSREQKLKRWRVAEPGVGHHGPTQLRHTFPEESVLKIHFEHHNILIAATIGLVRISSSLVVEVATVLRTSIIALALIGIPIIASAQGAGGGVGRVVLPAPATGTLHFNFLGNSQGGFVRPGYRGPGYPFSGIWGGYGGDLPPSLFYELYGYIPQGSRPLGPTYAPVVPPEPQVALSNEFPAVLCLELPLPGEVWANGKKGASKPTTEWTLTSPILKRGEEYTFDVKARWEVDGKVFEYTRTIAIEGGKRSRILVVSGIPVKE